ncbi:hypothetical protein ASPTUDRAFT_55282 [Aspergillus tubingensis CBS 134.48]|uniref:Uncharacterized protein n=1 Tax=Aspergillus tubingensis (strain CBS 134.48) TaxID=767770 RepID=A0A1L9N927_ASPTC|nr:hypothetical protein ASPTUDRAFT_55282 [Aspergillus tubingensis CBS 134.48]
MKDVTVCLWALEYDIRSLALECASYLRSAFWKGKLLAWRFCHDPELTVIKPRSSFAYCSLLEVPCLIATPKYEPARCAEPRATANLKRATCNAAAQQSGGAIETGRHIPAICHRLGGTIRREEMAGDMGFATAHPSRQVIATVTDGPWKGSQPERPRYGNEGNSISSRAGTGFTFPAALNLESSMERGSPDSERANIRESFQASGDRLDSSGRVALEYNAIVQPELIGRLAIVHPSVRTSVPLFIAWRLSSIPPARTSQKASMALPDSL